MSEKSVCQARASVMVYDEQMKKWKHAGNSQGLARVCIYRREVNPATYRVVGRKENDHEVVINCSIVANLKYNKATPTFHQWRDARTVYGLNFSSADDASNFSEAMASAISHLSAPVVDAGPSQAEIEAKREQQRLEEERLEQERQEAERLQREKQARERAAAGQMNPTIEYKYNATCLSHKVKIYWKREKENVTFEVIGKTTGWIGVGFIENGNTTGADIVVGWVDRGHVTVTDRKNTEVGFPSRSPQQHVNVLGGSESNGLTIFKFSKPRRSIDADIYFWYDKGPPLLCIYGDEDPITNNITEADYQGIIYRDFACVFGKFLCQDLLYCIPFDLFCDGKADCSDGSDEYIYKGQEYERECDGNDYRNSKKRCLLPERYVCDGKSHCIDGSDECLCPDDSKSGYFDNECSRCLGSPGVIIKRSQVCDGIVDCPDLSDECLCTKRKILLPICGEISIVAEENVTQHFACKEKNATAFQKLNVEKICDNVHDCESGIDEKNCKEVPCSEISNVDENVLEDDKCGYKCPGEEKTATRCDGNFECEYAFEEECRNGDKKCNNAPKICDYISFRYSSFNCPNEDRGIYGNRICDGSIDCSDGFDEMNCPNSHDCEAGIDEKNCKKVSCSEISNIDENVSEDDKCGYKCPVSDKTATRCDGNFECEYAFEEECRNGDKKCNNAPKSCDYFRSYSPFQCPNENRELFGSEICDGSTDCSDGFDEMNCPKRLYCANGSKTTNFPLRAKCNQYKDCDDGSDEWNCSFNCNDSSEKQLIDFNQLCDATFDCVSGIDECRPECIKSVFSNVKSLLASRPLYIFVWILSLVAFVGNLSVAGLSVRDFCRFKRNENPVKKLNKILVFNLSLSDLLVSIYLIAIGIENAKKEGKYCFVDRDWRSGIGCSVLGAILLIGSEQSVFTMIILTGLRLYTVVRPHRQVNLPLIKMLILSWLVSASLAIIPVLPQTQDYFVDSIRYQDNPLFSIINHKDVERYTKWLLLTSKYVNESAQFGFIGSWSRLEYLIGKLHKNYTVHGRFGYYSKHGVCVAPLFPDPDSDTSWIYTFFILLINFFAFLFILAGYVAMYCVTKKNRRKFQKKPDKNMQTKITRIIVTDFFCWMPICIMGMLQVFGIHISKDAYVFVGLILIPINSAMNPFLYSNIPEIITKKTAPVRAWICGHCATLRKRVSDCCIRPHEEQQERQVENIEMRVIEEVGN